ncbi:MAG: mechanosensitive ion channel family protein, partial [Acidobacteria bacterium]|nr:mechanosensitive ion channel family protein [Acidobacteriota bacterium]
MAKALILVVLTFACLAGPVVAAEKDPAPAPVVDTVMVKLDYMPLFPVRGVQAYTAEERAAAIRERIEKIADDRSINMDTLTAVDGELGIEIRAGQELIVTVLDADAVLEAVSPRILAQVYIKKIRQAITEYREQRTPAVIFKDIGFASLASLILAVVLVLLLKLFRYIISRLEKRYRRGMQDIGIQALKLLRAEQLWNLLISVVKLIRLIILLVLIYSYLNFVLSFFPWTRSLALNLFTHVLNPLETIGLAFIDFLPNLIFIVIIVLLTRYVLKGIRIMFIALEHKRVTFAGFEPEWARPTYKIVRLLVIVFILVIIYPYIPGADSPAFKGISILLGVLISLGSSSAISNIIAGYTMTYRRAFKIGDRIQVGDACGDVTAMRLLVTHLRTPKNEEVVIPNSLILSSNVTNYNTIARSQGLILHTSVTIGYDTPWRQVHTLLEQAAQRTPGIQSDPKPFVLQKSLEDFYVHYELNAYTDHPQSMARIYSALHQNIQDLFNEYGVQIMSPHYERDPEKPKVVPPAEWHAPPA